MFSSIQRALTSHLAHQSLFSAIMMIDACRRLALHGEDRRGYNFTPVNAIQRVAA